MEREYLHCPIISLEVFQLKCTYSSVPPLGANASSQNSNKTKVHNGNVIYQISSIPHPVPIIGSFTTVDNYVRIYKMTFDFIVSDPVLFANGYRLGKDPFILAIEIFKSGFLYHATRAEHDQVKILRVPDPKFNDNMTKDTGMKMHK